MTFPSVAAQVHRILEAIKKGEGPKALAAKVRELKTRLKDELNEREFLYIPPKRLKFYKAPMLFGKAVNDSGPDVDASTPARRSSRHAFRRDPGGSSANRRRSCLAACRPAARALARLHRYGTGGGAARWRLCLLAAQPENRRCEDVSVRPRRQLGQYKIRRRRRWSVDLARLGQGFSARSASRPAPADGRPDIPFAADDGDEVVFSRDRSLIAWPTPFEMNWMTGHSPSWRRNLYYRLHWHKRSGESFDLVWRLEEGRYRDEGWSEASRLGTTGLIDYSIIGPADSSVESVEQYLRRTKGWFDGDFRLEPAGVSPDGCCDVVRVIHRFDEAGVQPGGGLSR